MDNQPTSRDASMTDARRYLLILALIAVAVLLSAPFWEYPRAATAAVVVVSIVIYEAVWWGHVNKPHSDEFHDHGDARTHESAPPTV